MEETEQVIAEKPELFVITAVGAGLFSVMTMLFVFVHPFADVTVTV